MTSYTDTPQLSVDPDISRAETLSSHWYAAPEVLKEERRRIFAATWQKVGHVGQLQKAGDFFTTEIVGEPIVILRDHTDKIRAFFNVCRHRGGPLAKGSGNCKALQCEYHAWTYTLEGTLKFTPEFDGAACFSKENYNLHSVALETFGPFIFVNLSGKGPGLKEYLGEIAPEIAHIDIDSMSFFKRHTYTINCNWKVYVDNYLEGYHIPRVHPGLMREIDYPKYREDVRTFHSRQYAPVRNQNSIYHRNKDEGASTEALYYWLFPNLMWNIYPDNLQFNTIIPDGPDRTVTVFDWYVPNRLAAKMQTDFEASFAFSDEVQKEDIWICEQVQKGLNSMSYDRGRYSVQRETALHHFHLLYARYMNMP
jgi:choline monooxygenase